MNRNLCVALLGLAIAPWIVGCQPPAGPKKSSLRTNAAPSSVTTDGQPVVDEAAADPAPTNPTDKKADPATEDEKPDAPTSDNSVARAEFKPAIDKKANAPIKPGDWNQWGGTTYRNNTPIGKNVPTEWKPGTFDRKTHAWNKAKSKNIKWVSEVGSQTYGNPVIASGVAMVGTNNGAGYIKRYPSDVDLGVVVCFEEGDGKFLWQHSCEKLPTGRVHDWPQQGICAAAYIEGERAWITTSRGEIVCLDVKGFHDGEDDGQKNIPAKMFEIMKAEDAAMDKVAPAIAELDKGTLPDAAREAFTAGGLDLPKDIKVEVAEAGKKWTLQTDVGGADRALFIAAQGPKLVGYKVLSAADKDESDVVWTFDMMKEFGSSQHNMCSTSITCFGDILFCCTGNGVDESHVNIPAPTAPSFFALDKNTMEVYWSDNSPGENIIHGQWSSPAVAKLGGVDQVIYGGGDGWLYSFQADKGEKGKPKLLWKFDLNPKEAKWVLGGRGTRNEPIGTPVIYDGLVYIAVGQDPEHAEGPGHLYCIDPTKRGDVSESLVVMKDDPEKEVPPRRLDAVDPAKGEVSIPNPNTACVWHFTHVAGGGGGFADEMHRSIGTVAIKNDLLFVADFSGLFHCVDAKTGKRHWAYDMLAASWGSPLIVDDKVYMGDEDGDIVVFELKAEEHEPIAEINMGNSVYSTPVYANGILWIANKTHVFAIQDPAKAEVAAKE